MPRPKSSFVRIGRYFRKLRESAGLSQTFVANKLGYPNSQLISNFERGTCNPPLKILGRLIRLYKANPQEVLHLMLAEHERLLRSHIMPNRSAQLLHKEPSLTKSNRLRPVPPPRKAKDRGTRHRS